MPKNKSAVSASYNLKSKSTATKTSRSAPLTPTRHSHSDSPSCCASPCIPRNISLATPTTHTTVPKLTTKRCNMPRLPLFGVRAYKGGLLGLLLALSLCANLAASSPMQLQSQPQEQQSQQQQQSAVRVQQCREGCFEKFATKETLCRQNPECLTCWDECTKAPPPKINKSIRETWSIHTVAMLQQDSLVLVDVAWEPLSTPNQCLVTWEVSGGGLMGNLLTESFNVQLSLWPDTKYRVQVTCKNKLTGNMSRSLPLTIDTAEAIKTPEHTMQHQQQQQQQQRLMPYAFAPVSSTLPPLKLFNTFNANKNSNNNINNHIDSRNSINSIDSIANSNSASEELDDAEAGNLPVLPYEEQSAETLNQHTNFIFNWHTKNSDVSAIAPLHKPDLNILTIAALSDMQKPLLFGVVAGTLLLTFILLLYACAVRTQRVPSDKKALMEEDVHAVVVSLPPPPPPPAAAKVAATSQANMCQNAAHCSRNALRV